ncbi:hypothetical protein [Micromonospora sp. NBC_00389]|uniref:hypothetical protein n=1 Tax=Micromonospora sp. NBC_00389 TaxID=2903586 RepID=UPI002E1E2C13
MSVPALDDHRRYLSETRPELLHRHDHPDLVVAIQDAKNVVQTLDGTRTDADEPTGGFVSRDPGNVHMLTNVGGTTYLARLVELK